MAFFLPKQRQRVRRPSNRFRPHVETLEDRYVMAADLSAPSLFILEREVNDTIVQATLLTDVHAVAIEGSIDSPADVDWYTFTLDQAAHVTFTTATPFVLSLYNDVPFDYFDPYAMLGVRQLDQVEGTTLERILSAGTYHVAISGSGNLAFNPWLADSGLEGGTGDYQINFDAQALDVAPDAGPIVIATNVPDGSSFDSSPFVLRFSFNAPLNPDMLLAGSNVRITYNPTGSFGDWDDMDVPIDQLNFSTAANELQIVPGMTLAPGFYRILLAGSMETNWDVLTDVNGVAIGTDADHPLGQDFVVTFQVTASEGGSEADDTPPTAHELGDVTQAGLIQRAGAIGDDATDGTPFNPSDVDLYHFQITGTGNYALTAEVFARRFGSPLNAGVSLFRLNADTGLLELVAGNDDTLNDSLASNGLTRPLLSDPALFVGLTAGDYYLAVSSRNNVPDATRDQLPGVDGIFDPNVSHSGYTGVTTGPYILALRVQADSSPPTVVSVSLGSVEKAPTEFRVRFNEAVNLQQLAFSAYQQTSQASVASVSIEAADGTRYLPRFLGFDLATFEARFQMLDGLPNGTYTLHFSGALGLADLAGNPLLGNDASGDHVVTFKVAGDPRGNDGDSLNWNIDSGADVQVVGTLFPHELQEGVTFTRSAGDVSDSSDSLQIDLLQDQAYFFFLSSDLPGLTLTIRDALGDIVATAPQGTDGQLAFLKAGTYTLDIGGWRPSQSVTLAYQLRITLGGSGENPPPLTVGPAPAIRFRLTQSTTPPDLQPPSIPVPPASPPSTGGTSGTRPTTQMPFPTIFSALGAGPVGGVTNNSQTAANIVPDRLVISSSQVALAPAAFYLAVPEAIGPIDIKVLPTHLEPGHEPSFDLPEHLPLFLAIPHAISSNDESPRDENPDAVSVGPNQDEGTERATNSTPRRERSFLGPLLALVGCVAALMLEIPRRLASRTPRISR